MTNPTRLPNTTLNTHVTVTLGWGDRLRILLGRKAHVYVQEQLWISPHLIIEKANTTTSVEVEPLFAKSGEQDAAAPKGRK